MRENKGRETRKRDVKCGERQFEKYRDMSGKLGCVRGNEFKCGDGK